ncbi:MAG TPA: SIS domain-containing protein [Thermoplasmata archaeon]|nr:SIS domain-containing protein [Thermoplasmata archaeon]
MRTLARQLPEQLRAGFRSGRELDAKIPSTLVHAAVIGMGGSAIAGDLVGTVTSPETELRVDVVRSPALPRYLGAGTLALVASYSGNTWETLAAYDEAGRRGAPRVVLTSGGKLAERAARDGVPCLLVPAGNPPRASVGFMLGGLLGLLDPIFPESNEERVAHGIEMLESRITAFGSARGPPAKWAETVGNRRPAVYSETGFLGLARRWKTQVEENAKRGAEYDAIPELFHNAIVAWDAANSSEGRSRAVVLLEWSESDRETRARYAYLARLLSARHVPVVRVPLAATDRLMALFLGLSSGDFFSLALADRARVDPYPVDAITRMKTTLEARARGAGRRAN